MPISNNSVRLINIVKDTLTGDVLSATLSSPFKCFFSENKRYLKNKYFKSEQNIESLRISAECLIYKLQQIPDVDNTLIELQSDNRRFNIVMESPISFLLRGTTVLLEERV